MGKLTNKELKKLLNCIQKDPRVVVSPMIGYDSGVHKVEGKYLVVASDPCTGVPEDWFGWLLVNYAASDVALSGAKPEFCTINLLAPLGTKPEVFQRIMKQTCQAADELDIAIVRGHTGMYSTIQGLVGVATVYGSVELDKLITSGGAKPGDLVMCNKPLGLETLTNFAITHKKLAQKLFGAEQQQNLSGQVKMQSCVREALQLAQVGGFHAMHDATEGGFVAALNELSEASGVGFKVDWESIPISQEAYALQRHFKLSNEQLLSMSSTGTILAAVDPKAQEKIKATLTGNGLQTHFLGTLTKQEERLLTKNGKAQPFPQVANDPYTQIMKE